MIPKIKKTTIVSHDRLISKLREIEIAIFKNYKKERTSGGVAGTSGLAAFMFTYSAYLDNNSYAGKGQNILRHSVNSALEQPINYTYCSGLAGLGYTLEILKDQKYIEIDSDELFEDVDELLFKKMVADLENSYFDVLHGGMGYFLYFIKKHQSTPSESHKIKYLSYLDEGLKLLEALAIRDNDAIYWPSTLPPENERWMVNTSLSHGLCSILSTLADVLEISTLRFRAKILIDKSLRYLTKFKNLDESLSSIFPTWIDPQKKMPLHQGRTAWCYGDLGIALTFLKLASNKQFKYLENEAVALLDFNILKNKDEQLSVLDTGFCHGTFGVAHCYGIAFEKLGSLAYKKEQEYWIKKAFEMERPEYDYAGFPMHIGREKVWDGRLSVLEGIAGIGLVIIDYLNGKRGKWDEILLLG